MQTFLPSLSFEQSARWLDSRRLGKQRVECLQILKALTDSNYGWQNHPAVKMWRGYEYYLVDYALGICDAWIERGYKDSCAKKIYQTYKDSQSDYPNVEKVYPPWLTEEFCSNHRAILLGKAQENYRKANVRLLGAVYGNADFKECRIAERKLVKAVEVDNWYNQFKWTEQPAKRVDGKWPYLWPEAV